MTETRVLSVLAPGGQLTTDQIARDADISKAQARSGVLALHKRGFATDRAGMRRDAWTLTSSGARYVGSPRGRAVLDLPAAAS
jgi:predicted ArsR family transcriptional regulator